MTSIRHFPATHPLPDWRNFGVMLRVLLGINGLAALAALIQSARLDDWPTRYVELAAFVEPLLLCGLGLLALLRDALWRLPLRLAQLVVLCLIGGITTAFSSYAGSLPLGLGGSVARTVLLALAACSLLLFYFELRARAYSPALAEARLAALDARIRPHFLFNTLNAVLSLIRSQPQRAEAALESLADLFRAALRDPGALSTLDDELALGRQYIELEHLRLGDRLRADWRIEVPSLALPVPPFLLQPLLENAVHHGIEPSPEGGEIVVNVSLRGEQLSLEVSNPRDPAAAEPRGKRMALANIRERLMLYYDLEARLEIDAGDSRYQVRIILPCRQKTL